MDFLNGFDADFREESTLSVENQEVLELFKKLDLDNNCFIDSEELMEAFAMVDIKIAPYEVRKLIDENEVNIQDGKLDLKEFVGLCERLKRERDYGRQFKQMVKKRTDIQTLGGLAGEKSNEETTHSIAHNEMVSFSEWINRNLHSNSLCGHFLPIDIQSGDLYHKLKDGILLCCLINYSVPQTIDIRAINTKNLNLYQQRENMTLAINSAESVGCSITNIHVEDVMRGKPHICLGLIWQIVRIGLLNRVNLQEVPGLLTLKNENENMEHFMNLPPEEILYRWVNYHLANAGTSLRVSNFSTDIQDSQVYTYLLHQIAPKDRRVTLMALEENDLMKRADMVIAEASKLDAKHFVTRPLDIVSGNPRLNLAFVANLFNTYSGLEASLVEMQEDMNQFQETREEKTYRNWINSLGVNPFVYHLYSDVHNGLILLQLYEAINPGSVDWSKVHFKFNNMKVRFEKLENCNYAVNLGKKCHFSLIGIGGQDILESNRTLTLALIWQLMRAYTLNILTAFTQPGNSLTDQEIITWANKTLASKKKNRSFQGFQDPCLSDGLILIDLIDCIRPGAIDYRLVSKVNTEETKLRNAQYAISMARKIGARVYALPEDIVELKHKMIMTIFACLMMTAFQARHKNHGN